MFKIVEQHPEISDQSVKVSGRKVAFMTLGCKVNQYETEAMSELFVQKGYHVVPSEAMADVYVVNTCSVTNLGEKKSRQYIRKMKRQNPNAIMAVVGCYSQVATDEVLAIEGVNLVVGTDERKKIVDFVEDVQPGEQVSYVGDIMKVKTFEALEIENVSDKTRAFIKIQEGCNQFCSYCIIPYARGPIRSRGLESIISEVQRLVAHGFKEFVLTGIHIASYGKDTGEGTLLDVIAAVHDIAGVERLRLGSLEPRLLTAEFIARVKEMPRFTPHFHLSLQSGSDSVLKRMNRKYDTNEYLQGVEALKLAFDKPSFTTDVIVGFPGETDEEFKETLDFVQKVGFAKIHVFQYSPKKGTKAADMPCQITSEIKHKRSEQLIACSDQMEQAYYSSLLGTTAGVLFERETDQSMVYCEGLSERYVRVAVTMQPQLIGQIKEVLLERVEGDLIYGKLV